jgi:aryl-alcohol dehydrogenase-like predicted oxidoreductase
MERRALGGSDLRIAPVGVGTAPIGSVPGHWWVNWGRQDERDSLAAIHAALDGGVNLGRHGALLRAADAVRADLEASLRRLRRDHVDLLQPHDVDREVPIEETWGAIHELIAEGKIRHAGLSNHPRELVERALAVGPVASLQFEYRALQRREEERLLPFALEPRPRVIVWAPLASGFLTDGFDLEGHRRDRRCPQRARGAGDRNGLESWRSKIALRLTSATPIGKSAAGSYK